MSISREEWNKKIVSGAFSYKCSYEEYIACWCPTCDKRETCIHAMAYRRMPVIDGGLGLCPNLKDF